MKNRSISATDVIATVGWCAVGHLDMVTFLLEQGADLEHKTDEMHTALMEASMDGHVDVARYLLDRGAQVRHPLMILYAGQLQSGNMCIVPPRCVVF